jgi:methylenetetrahydrofolate dehydrogenase (NADP+)/methenyltetrahydrofolate cyclohydrolase
MILDGKKIAERIRADLTKKIEGLSSRPKLVVILLGESPASLTYIKQKRNACQEV